MEENNSAASKPAKNWLMPTLVIIVLIAVIVFGSIFVKNKNAEEAKAKTVKIGVVTDLTGAVSYWGTSSQVGAELAKKDLEAEGYKVELVFEDYQMDAAKALTSAEKLTNVDNVDAIYAEFNPAAISIGSFIKGKNKIFLYDAAVTSPLEGNGNAFKTYLDYQVGGKEIAQKFQAQGIEKIGVLKLNLEAGELFTEGVKEVYGANAVVESFDIGATELKTQVLKLKNAGAQAVVISAFEGDTINTLKAMTELNYDVPFGTVDDTITSSVTDTYAAALEGAWTFGFPSVDADFSSRLKASTNKTIATEYGAAITYTHIKQIVKALADNNKDLAKASKALAESPEDSTIGFVKFTNNIADLKMTIKQY